MPGCLFMSSFEYPKVSLVGWVREQKSNPSPRVKLGILKTLSLRPQWRLATNGFFCGCSLSVDTQSGLPQALFYSSMVCSSQLVVVFYLAYFSSIHHFFSGLNAFFDTVEYKYFVLHFWEQRYSCNYVFFLATIHIQNEDQQHTHTLQNNSKKKGTEDKMDSL